MKYTTVNPSVFILLTHWIISLTHRILFLNKQTLADKEDHNGSARDNVVCCVSSPCFIATELHTERDCCFRGQRLNMTRLPACIYWKYFYFLQIKKKKKNINNLIFITNLIQASSRYTHNFIFGYKFCLCYSDVLFLIYFEFCIITLQHSKMHSNHTTVYQQHFTSTPENSKKHTVKPDSRVVI